MSPDAFIARWTAREGGAERANYQGFLYDLCDVIGVGRPDVAGADASRNDYVFERAVRSRIDEGAPKRIDLYKRGCFILEAKQSRLPGRPKAPPEQHAMFEADAEHPLGRRSAARGWDAMMLNARQQAQSYVFLLEPEHAAPPFLIVCDVGHCLELYADFSGTGRGYAHYPDRQGFRLHLDDLRKPERREQLATIWSDPRTLDPAAETARVTRGIAKRLASVSKALEETHPGRAEDVAHFLMRCIFTMFAQGVGLLPKDRFTELLRECVVSPRSFRPMVEELWSKMDEPESAKRFSTAISAEVPYFNGNLFHKAQAYALEREEIGELLAASEASWTDVDPAIFGALLEQALEKTERKRLGAHYTPRAYVQRLVDVTIMEPLRADWQAALTKAEAAKRAGDDRRAVAAVRDFHKKLCATRVLDPACGTGNFLYVALELMKSLEGEVLETLAKLGESESMGLDRETVDPHQFLGLELNPRAAAIAELVVWIGYLQQHYRARSGHPGEPILKAFKNINFGTGKAYDAVLTWDGFPQTTVETRGGLRVETYPNARRPEWPEAEFIVGNPPFIGKGSVMRAALGDGYVEALWRAHPQMNESADFVMYWWDRAAELLACNGSALKRFGLVTTNSISQPFNRRVLERRLADGAIGLVFAIEDHPWTKASRDSAAVRIAMTVGEAGKPMGRLARVESEHGLDGDEPLISFAITTGRIGPDLTVGDDDPVRPLLAGAGLSWNGVMLAAKRFVLDFAEADRLTTDDDGQRNVIKSFLRGADLLRAPKERYVVDMTGLAAAEARRVAPAAYQHLLAAVKPERDKARDRAFRERWWLFGRTRPEMRAALAGLKRYVGTTETAKHRVFQFVDAAVLPDHMIVAIATENAFDLAVLSSRVHVSWTLARGGLLEDRPRYTKSEIFDPFPFPAPSPALRASLAAAGEELDALRKSIQAEHPDLTLTGLYNVLEKLKASSALSAKEEDVKDRGLVLILKELHETIDRLTLDAYGWPRDLSDDDALARLVALNGERAKEEEAGHVRWLRPDYQIPRFGTGRSVRPEQLELPKAAAAAAAIRPRFPRDPYEQPLAVEAALASANRPLGAGDLARVFGGAGARREEQIDVALTTLAIYGRVMALGDGRYTAMRAI